jgi:hypothetical protein
MLVDSLFAVLNGRATHQSAPSKGGDAAKFANEFTQTVLAQRPIEASVRNTASAEHMRKTVINLKQ